VVSHDDLKRNLLEPLTEQSGSSCSITFCDYGTELLFELSKMADSQLPTLIVLDAGNMQPDGLSTLRRIKNSKRLRSIPTILLVEQDQPDAILQGYKLGANAIVARPKLTADFKDMCRYWLQTVLHPTNYLYDFVAEK
jgi:CheY-like chemotaxis protein